MLPLIIGGLVAAVGFAAGALSTHAAGEQDRQAAQYQNKVNEELLKRSDDLQQKYNELGHESQNQVSDLEKRLMESELEKDALYLVVRLQNSLLMLQQGIDRNPSLEVLLKFREAVDQTNIVLTHLCEEAIPLPKDYFSRNLTRAKMQITRSGIALTPEQKSMLYKILPTASDAAIECPDCGTRNAVMKKVPTISCCGCGHSIDLITYQHKIQWNRSTQPILAGAIA
jgi:hypothetical protein